MKKSILLSLLCVTAISLNAQIFVENFKTATVGGNLEGYNNWYVSLKATEAYGVSPKISEGALFYTGYYGSNIGNVAELDSMVGTTSATQRISTKVIKFENDTLKAVAGEKIYTAFMVNISQHSNRSYRDFFTYEGSKTSSSTRGRIFAKVNTAGDNLFLALSKNSSTAGQYIESTSIPGLTLATEINHLLVFCYETIEGDDNDIISLYIDPDLSKTEAEQTNKLIASDIATDYGLTAGLGINLRQRGIGAQVGGIRIGKSWDAVLLGVGTDTKQINIDDNSIYSYGKTIVINGIGNVTIYNLTGNEVLSSKITGKLETSLNQGLYIVRFIDNNGKVVSGKVEIK